MTQTAPLPVIVHTSSAPVARTSRTSRTTSGLILALVSALAFSSSGPLIKPLLEAGWSLSAALTVRMGLAGLVLSPLLIRAVRAEPRFFLRHWRALLAFGLAPVAGCQLFYFAAMQRMPVAVALLIQYLAPVLLVLFIWARTRRAPSYLVIAGSVVAVAGLVLVVDFVGARVDLVGVLLALCAAVCVCVYFVMAERTGDHLPPLALAAGGLIVGTIFVALLGVTGILPFHAPAVNVHVAGIELPAIVPLLWVGGVGTSVGYALGIMAVPRIGSRLASFVGLSEVLFALVFAWLLLGEVPTGVQCAGGALILVGVLLVRIDARAVTSVAVEPLPEVAAPGIR